MERQIYLDNSATTRVDDRVVELMKKAFLSDYGNPSSMHVMGINSNAYAEKAGRQLAASLGCEPKNFIYTSCGTESDNLAIIGGALANSRTGKHIITTAVEHPAVTESVKRLTEYGFETSYLSVDESGVIDLDELKSALRPDTCLVSIMAVNNETGAVMPIAGAGLIIKENNKKTLFHVDAVQGFGHLALRPASMNIDLLSISGHKIHGPKGVGALYIAKGVKVKSLMVGGGQQGNLRSGTLNIPGIAGLGLAAELATKDIEGKRKKLFALKNRLARGIAELGDIHINGPEINEGAPHILNVSFAGVRAEVLLHALEEKGIFVSSGSACASHHPGVSAALKAMGLPDKYLTSAIRFSMSEWTTEEEIDYTVSSLGELLPILRRFR